MLYVFAGTLLIILSFSINVMAQDKIPHAGIIADSFEIEDPKEPDTLKSGRLRANSLPSKYDARDDGLVTSVKDQGDVGSCWAFGANAALESSLIKSGLETASVNLSELHMMYFMYSANKDPYGRISKDRNFLSDDYVNTPTKNFALIADAGASIMTVGWQLTDGVIPYNEDADENYEGSIFNSSFSIDQSKCFSDKYSIKNMLSCSLNIENSDNVKNLIYKYGGVFGSYYSIQTTFYKWYRWLFQCGRRNKNLSLSQRK